MKTLYIECAMGAAGDMLAGALIELLPDKAAFIARLNSLGLPGVHMSAESAVSCGLAGTHFRVTVHGEEEHSHDCHAGEEHHHEHHHHHHHSSPADIDAILSGLDLPEKAKNDAQAVYSLIASAEARAHGTEVAHIHFHEVGSLDAVADVAAVCLALAELRPERIVASPVRTGYGFVHCAHGVLPVPAPATAYLLEGVPCYAGDIEGEMCTPTGAALLKYFTQEFSQRPAMTIEKSGCGMGTKDFGSAANCVRAFLGESAESAGFESDAAELTCNIDDMTAEALAYAMERIMASGALDVAAIPAVMKKGRPGHILLTIAKSGDAERLAKLILRETATNGVRLKPCERLKLEPGSAVVTTEYGDVRIKTASGFGAEHKKPEYEDVAAIARGKGLPFDEVWRAAANKL